MNRLVLGLVLVAACGREAPNLSTTEQMTVVVSPISYSYGDLQVGQTSAPRSFEVRPSIGNQYDEVTAVTENCPDFTVSAPGLPAAVYRVCEYDPCELCFTQPPCITTEYVTYSFTATFRPNVAGATSCVVTVQTNGGTNQTITLSGNGTLPPIDIDVQPTSVAFGDVRRNTTSSTAQVTTRNLGGSTLTVSSISVSAGFAIVSGATSGAVAPNGMMTNGIVCQPATTGPKSGQLVIQSNDPATPTVTVPLSCNGIDSNLDISPSPAAIPTTRVGEPQTQTIALRNSGAATMTIESVTLTGAEISMGAAPTAGTTLGANATANVTVTFAAAAAGDATGQLVVAYDGGQTRTAQISARALSTSMALTPDGAVDLGPVCIGHDKEQPFKILANDQGGFSVSQITMPSAPFTVSAPGLPATVQGAGATELGFTVTATPTEPGAITSSLSVTTDIPGGTPREIQLSVEGLIAGVTGAPAMVDFGSHPVDTTTFGQEVHVSNCSTASVELSNPRIEGPDALEFAIVANPTSLTVPAAGLATWLVVLQARSVGPKTAVFSVDHPGGVATVALDGEGLGETVDDAGDDGRPSYYACSTGRASSAWLLAFAIALIVVRRRRR